MKVLKKQGLMLMLIAALVVTLTLGIIFMLPARTAMAEEDVFKDAPTVEVSTEEQLKDEVTKAGTTAKKIVLKNDIEMKAISSTADKTYYQLIIGRGQKIQLDLAGHTLSVAYCKDIQRVIENYGTLVIDDTSASSTGKILTNGYYYYDNSQWSWRSTPYVRNYSALTIKNASFVTNIPESPNKGEEGYYDYIYGTPEPLIYSELYIPAPTEEVQEIIPASLTINGGTFTQTSYLNSRGDLSKLDHLFKIVDSDLTINGGTFVNPVRDKSSYNGFLAEIGCKPIQTPEVEAKIKAFRNVEININGGDFTAIGTKYTEILYTFNYENNRKGIEGENYTIQITDGKFAVDFSAFVGDGYWMEHVQETSQSGEIIEEFYQVALADSAKAEASVTVNGDERIYASFGAAWNAVRLMQAESHTVTLKRNATIANLDFNNISGEVILELNGYKLTIEPATASGKFITPSSNSKYSNKLIIQDTNENDGELVLSAANGHGKSNPFISLDSNGNTHYELRSGTIRLTGTIVDDYYGKTSKQIKASGNAKSSDWEYAWGQSLFGLELTGCYSASACTQYYESHREEFQNLVVIKGGNIISEINTTTKGPQVGDFFAMQADSSLSKSKYDYDIFAANPVISNKDEFFVLDLNDYLADGSRACKFSWDFGKFVSEDEGLTSSETSDGYIVSLASDGENFIVGSNATKTETLQAALEAAADNDTISVIQSTTVAEAVTINKGITLNLNIVANFQLTFEKGVTLLGGASIKYGVINGVVTVSGDASLENVTLDGNVTVSGGTLTILSGTYKGEFTVNGGDMAISGGSFKGSQIGKLNQYFGEYLGALDENNEYDYENENNSQKLYTVKFGPNLAAQAWHQKFQNNVYEISSTDDWLSFSLFVNSGLDNFKGKTVKLTKELNFDPNAANGIAVVAEAQAPNFLPAGNKQHAFAGTFDGNGMTMSNIVAQERAVGLFGYTTGDSRFRNIILQDSIFNTGNGFLDKLNGNGYYAGGALIGEGFMGGNADETDWSGKITLNNVKVGYDPSAQNFIGGVIGHSWGNVYIDVLNFQKGTTVASNWKMGGIVGYLEGSFYIKKADIEEGTEGNPNGLILDDDNAFFAAGALVGHANGSNNTIEDCKVLEPDDSLIGTTYAGGTDSRITIKGSETELDIYRVVGAGRAEGSTTEVELSQEVTEEGVRRGSVKLQETEKGMKFYEEKDGKKTPLEVQRNEQDGGFEAVAKLDVTIGKIVVPAMTYSATEAKEATLTSFVLYNELGNMLDNEEYQYLKNLNVVVTLQLSKSTVGKQMALITSYTITGADANKYTFQLTGNQTFIEVEVTAKTLQVSVNGNGEVEYNGFVGGENESVLGGILTLDKVDNGDGTYTVTPSGLESENYNIVYVSSVVPAAAFETESNALWIALAVVGSAILLLAAVAVVYTVRKRRE